MKWNGEEMENLFKHNENSFIRMYKKENRNKKKEKKSDQFYSFVQKNFLLSAAFFQPPFSHSLHKSLQAFLV